MSDADQPPTDDHDDTDSKTDDHDPPRFQQDRKNWAGAADAIAADFYCDWWGVTHDDVYELESLVDDVHDREEGYRTHQLIDYAGIDRFVDLTDRVLAIAERSRPPNQHWGVDLSVRVDNGVPGRCAEYEKWRNAHRTGRGVIPDVLAFGLWEGTLEVFQRFALIDCPAMVAAIDAGDLAGVRHTNDDGTEAMYITLDDLQTVDCVLTTATGVGVGVDHGDDSSSAGHAPGDADD